MALAAGVANAKQDARLKAILKKVVPEGAGVIVVINRPMPDALSRALNIRSGKTEAKDMEELREHRRSEDRKAKEGVQ
mgnify:CR=1 FL=1